MQVETILAGYEIEDLLKARIAALDLMVHGSVLPLRNAAPDIKTNAQRILELVALLEGME